MFRVCAKAIAYSGVLTRTDANNFRESPPDKRAISVEFSVLPGWSGLSGTRRVMMPPMVARRAKRLKPNGKPIDLERVPSRFHFFELSLVVEQLDRAA